MGNWKAAFPILIALVIAVSGSYFLYNWMQAQQRPGKPAATDAAPAVATVIVAKVDLPGGTKLTPEMVKSAQFLESSVPQNHFSTIAEVTGRVVIAFLKQGDPIVAHRLAPTSVESGGVSAIIQPGKRAIAVKGDKVIGLSGFINPGNRVDVLVTIKDPRQNVEKTKAVLENIPVLASGTQMIENDKGDPSPVDVYTLEVTPEEGEKLALAATRGKLQFMLRNAMDYDAIVTHGATIPNMLASMTPALVPPKGLYTPASPPKVHKVRPKRHRTAKKQGVVVEVIRGLSLTKEKL